MANLNFINANTVPGISNQMARQGVADRIAEDQSLRTRYDFDERRRGADALNSAINSIQARGSVVAPVPQSPESVPVAVPELRVPADSAEAGESANLPPANAGQRVAASSPISGVTTQQTTPTTPTTQKPLTRQDLITALGTDRSTAAQRLQLMQGEVTHNEQLDNQNRERSNKMADHVWELAKTNDPANLAQAKLLSQQNGMQIPDEFWTNKNMRANFIGRIDMFHKLGLRGDQIPAAIKNLQTATGANDDEKLMNAVANVPAGLAWNPYTRAGGGSGASGGVEGWKFKMWQETNPGGSYEDYRKFAGGPKSDVRARMIMGAMKAKDAYGDPVYAAQEQAAAAVDAALRQPNPSASPTADNESDAHAQAKDAIARGADPVAVNARLKKAGYRAVQ